MNNPLHDRLISIIGPNDPAFLNRVIYLMTYLAADLENLPDHIFDRLACLANGKVLVSMAEHDAKTRS